MMSIPEVTITSWKIQERLKQLRSKSFVRVSRVCSSPERELNGSIVPSGYLRRFLMVGMAESFGNKASLPAVCRYLMKLRRETMKSSSWSRNESAKSKTAYL